ncbi:MAG: exonuclease SbcCD subunit D C-terminal domain-containing protein [Desulfobacterales bacterium]|nr:exonuclease SbcCD subunit D C-terminal domain-containing protein [Desulfobacterales bacterium]
MRCQCFQPLATVRGDWSRIVERIAELKKAGASVWLEIIYEGDEVIGDLQERLRELVDGTVPGDSAVEEPAIGGADLEPHGSR